MNPLTKSHDYKAINNFDEDPDQISPAPSHRNRWKQHLVYISVALISSLLTASIITVPQLLLHTKLFPNNTKNDPLKTIDLHCGTTPSEARALGCHFDMMASRWEHPLCHSPSLLNHYLSTAPYEWYQDANHTEHIPRSVVAEGNFPHEFLYVKGEPGYHIGHCMYMWMKQDREFRSGGPVSESVWEQGHTRHCSMLVQGQWPPFARTMAGFSRCRSVDVWRRIEEKGEKGR